VGNRKELGGGDAPAGSFDPVERPAGSLRQGHTGKRCQRNYNGWRLEDAWLDAIDHASTSKRSAGNCFVATPLATTPSQLSRRLRFGAEAFSSEPPFSRRGSRAGAARRPGCGTDFSSAPFLTGAPVVALCPAGSSAGDLSRLGAMPVVFMAGRDCGPPTAIGRRSRPRLISLVPIRSHPASALAPYLPLPPTILARRENGNSRHPFQGSPACRASPPAPRWTPPIRASGIAMPH